MVSSTTQRYRSSPVTAVPQDFPTLPADANCAKCRGTGYKKSIFGKLKACKRCAVKYGTDVRSINSMGLRAAVVPSNFPKI